MIEMKVFGLALDEESQSPVLVLKDMDDKRALPIWIGAMEAMAISLSLNNVTMPRPMTHDLLLNVFRDLGANVAAVEVTALTEGTYYAEIEAKAGERVIRVDCRPSDGVALALRAQCPIRVAEAVLDAASVDGKTPGDQVLKGEEADKWAELLENLDPDSSKKM